jgi:hypothetical protein
MPMDNITARLTQAQTQIGQDINTPAVSLEALEMELKNTQIAVVALIELMKQMAELVPAQGQATPPTAPPTPMMGA